MPDRRGEQKFFWLLLVLLAGGLLAGVIFPRYREVSHAAEKVELLRQEKEELRSEVDKLRQMIKALQEEDKAAWERAVRSRLRYHPAGTAVFTGAPEGEKD